MPNHGDRATKGARGAFVGSPARRRAWPRAMALALGVTLAASALEWAAAQRGEARIAVAATIVAEPASQAALQIQVGPPGALPSNSFIRLRGLPASVSLTEGHAIAPGSWAIPLFVLPSLKANVPAGVSGRSEIIIQLVAVDGTMLAEGRTALIVAPAASVAAAPAEPQQKRSSLVPPLPPVARPVPRQSELSAEERARADRLVSQGERHLDQGNIGAARLFFQRAAEAGSARGAIRLAATYDPAELGRLQVQGVNPDRNEARKWYERARELGAPEAEERLARLAGS